MTSAIRAGRIVAFLTGMVFVTIYAALIRQIFRDWRVALLTTSAFAFSGGVAVQIRILRSEMIAGCFFAFAMLGLIIVAKRASPWRPLVIAAAAALCVLGMENKVQVILPIAALPFVMLTFGGRETASDSFWNNSARAWLTTITAAMVAALAFAAALPLIRAGLDPAATSASHLRPLFFGRFFTYQIALLAAIGGCMIAYAVIWRVSLTETLTAIFAVIAGASVALLALKLNHNVGNVVAVINPIEKMLTFAGVDPRSAAEGDHFLASLLPLIANVKSVLARYAFVLHTSPRPTVFLVWLIVPGIFVAWRRGERQVALQATMLMLAAIGIDSLGVQRGLKTEYFIFTDPLIILAGALLLERLDDLRWAKWTYPIGMLLIVVHIAVSQAEPVKHVLKKSGPEYICEWNQVYEPELPLPWCALPAKKP